MSKKLLFKILGVLVNIGVMLLNVFVFKMEIGGLALATTISSVFIALSLMIMINRKGNRVITKGFIADLVKIIISSAVAVFIAGGVYGIIKDMFGEGMLMTLIKLCIASLPALIVYLGLGFLLKLEMLKELRRNK